MLRNGKMIRNKIIGQNIRRRATENDKSLEMYSGGYGIKSYERGDIKDDPEDV